MNCVKGKYKPLFITPFIFNEWNINSVINTTFVNSLPDSFQPKVLCTKYSCCSEKDQLLVTNGSVLARGVLRFLPQALIRRLEQSPDIYYYYWYKSAIKKASSIIEHGNISYIHSISIPYTSHLVAYELKKKFAIPWIAQFYEPWGDNPYRTINKTIISRNIKWEKECATSADVILHNNDLICNHWREKYGIMIEGKLFSMPMPFLFDRNCLISNKKSIEGKLRITHIGNFYGLRKANTFIKALYELILENPLLRDKIEVSFVGVMNSDDVLLVEKYKLLDVVKIVGSLSERECEHFYQNSDIFLLVEAEGQGPFFFPSKLARYYFYNRPILALTNENSVTSYELNKAGHNCCLPSDICRIKAYLLNALNNYSSLLDFDRSAWKRFDPDNVSQQYCKIVSQIF